MKIKKLFLLVPLLVSLTKRVIIYAVIFLYLFKVDTFQIKPSIETK